ncbi:predicted protein [Sclerotinia sclerotiorum 1980 UF-70]|uniref:Uncharacterized protein n=2 Tax=Sclerotinia sclerotiorum (strain ATCC 18683 / 1980 / Ss-1) TaxID=665079 RepID=A7F6B1_SCLS1|nr:predicted protein [Sclerotinia sclerotiorum 1980 UF-70]APA07306.1 hypothetical protein sscle_02g020760 [Sclerotinia sclerotiorum 1980 UF-70]EDN98282.1 predicted protein [Sclerotinia sclerotiorum 1980 UF-70]
MPLNTQTDILNSKAPIQPPESPTARAYYRKDAASRGKEDQHSSNVPIHQRNTETMIRNKIMWEKNILPKGRIDWVIVGFNAPASVEKKAEAQIDFEKTVEKDSKDSEDNITATIPLELEPTIKENALRLVIRESPRNWLQKLSRSQSSLPRNLSQTRSLSSRRRVVERGSRDLRLITQSNQKSKTTSSTPTPHRPLSNPHSCNVSPKSPLANELHPAEVLRSYQGSINSSRDNFTPIYCPNVDIQGQKARLTTSIYPRANQTLTIRPKKSVSVASRMITHALGARGPSAWRVVWRIREDSDVGLLLDASHILALDVLNLLSLKC